MSTEPGKIDVREVIDRIRRAIAVRTPGEEQSLAADLAVYSGLCKLANQRLRDCLSLVKHGQYSNAIALADQEPSLLDFCSDLDIPEVELLPNVATSLQIATPERINVSLVEALQEAYDKRNTAAGNMRLLHKLTLARAPLPARLYVMRRLMAQDTNHPYLEADIRHFETSWYRRSVDYCKPFAEDGDVEMIQMVIDDLVNSGYLETPPKTLLSSLESLLHKTRQTRLPLLAEQIREAFSQKSLNQLQTLFDHWSEQTRQAGVDSHDPRYELAEAARWLKSGLDDQRKCHEEQQASANLARSIQQRNVRRIDLENAYSVARAHAVVDELLESQYRARLAELGRRQTSLLLFSGIGTVAVIALVAIGSFWFVQSRQHENDVAKLLNELEPLAEAGRHDEVIRKGDEAPRAVSSNPRVIAIVRASRDSQTRQNALDRAIAAIAECPPDGNIAPLVEQAIQLTSAEPDRKRVDAEYSEWKSRKTEFQRVSRLEFEKGVNDLGSAIDRLATENAWSADILATKLKSFEDKAKGLREFARAKGLGEGTLPDVEKKLKVLQSRIAVAGMMKDYVERHSKSSFETPPLQEIADFLSETLARECRDPSLETRLKAAKSDLAVWKSVHKLREQLIKRQFPSAAETQTWMGTPVRPVISLCSNESQLAESRRFQKPVPGQPQSETAQLMDRLTAADMKDVTCVRAAGFTSPYFTHTPVAPGDDKVEIKYLIDLKGTTLPTKITGQRNIYPAPQSEYLAKVEPLFADASRSWHSVMVQGYSHLLDNQKIDPLLKLQLADRFLSTLYSSSTAFRELLDAQDAAFKKVYRSSQKVSGVWYRPEEEDKLESVRAEAVNLCSQAPKLTPQDAERAEKRDSQLAESYRHGIQIVGLLSPDSAEAGIAIFTGATLDRDGALFVVAVGKWIEVGKVTGTKILLTSEAASHIGWPVIYICKTQA